MIFCSRCVPLFITSTTKGDIKVDIAGAACDVEEVKDTQVKCRTGSAKSGSAKAKVKLQRSGWGLAEQVSRLC